MQIIIGLLFIFVFVATLGFIGLLYYNKLEELKIYINEAEANIDNSLRTKFDIMNRLIKVITANVKVEEDLFEDFIKIRGRKLSNFDMDRKLTDLENIFYDLSLTHKEVREIDTYNKMLRKLKRNDVKLLASKDYYNTTITEYNKLVKKVPSNLVAKFTNHEHLTFFDGKNMEDDVYNDFKI